MTVLLWIIGGIIGLNAIMLIILVLFNIPDDRRWRHEHGGIRGSTNSRSKGGRNNTAG